MNKTLAARAAVLALAASALLGGCNRAATTTDAAGKTEAPVAASAPAPNFSINEMMVWVVEQQGQLLWDVEKAGHAPKTAEDWYQLENHAVSLAAAGTLIQLGGTGPADMAWAKDPQWKASSQELIAAALAARQAAKSKNFDALLKANGQIVDACEACHAKFKPNIPTGNLFIHQRPPADG